MFITHFPHFPAYDGPIGILGGSFNPAHEGHVYISLQAKKRLGLSQVWWLVSPQNPMKSTQGMAPFEERCEGARRLTRDYPFIRVSDMEHRLQMRYTCDFIRYLVRTYPKSQFVWIMGSDNWAHFHQWKDWEFIAAHIRIVVLDRGSDGVRALKGRAAMKLAPRRVGVNALMDAAVPAWSYLPIYRHPASATAIRGGST